MNFGSKTQSFDLANDHYDENTRSLKSIEFSHNQIHEGEHYYFDFTSVTLAAQDVFEILIETPNTTKWGHFVYDIEAPLGMTLEIFEGTDATSGISITAFNNNRNSINTSGMTISHTPIITTDGTLIKSRKSGSSIVAFKESGNLRADDEKIFKQNTKYLIRLTSNISQNYVSGTFGWYEYINLSN